MTPSYEEMPSGEFCVQRDIGAKDFGGRTVLLGVFCELRKFSFGNGSCAKWCHLGPLPHTTALSGFLKHRMSRCAPVIADVRLLAQQRESVANEVQTIAACYDLKRADDGYEFCENRL